MKNKPKWKSEYTLNRLILVTHLHYPSFEMLVLMDNPTVDGKIKKWIDDRHDVNPDDIAQLEIDAIAEAIRFNNKSVCNQ